MNAPEQLWPRAYTQAEADGPSYSGAVKYVRADIHAAVVAERDAINGEWCEWTDDYDPLIDGMDYQKQRVGKVTQWRFRPALSQPMPEEKTG